MEKIAYIIPGLGENPRKRCYKEIASSFKKKNIDVVGVRMPWKRHVMSDYIDYFLNEYYKEGKETYLLGFSFGAYISFVASSKISPQLQFLCSLSPYFKEDLHLIRPSWTHYWGKRRMEDYKNFSFSNIAKDISCRTLLIVGDQEGPEILRRAQDAHKKISNSKLVIMENVRHNIGDQKYINTVKGLIDRCIK